MTAGMSREQSLLARLAQPSDKRILQIVLDGIGDLPNESGLTPLEAAHTPNLDALAETSELGQVDPVFPGITPGSGIAHLALFGYDPLTWDVGRGAVAAAGVGLRLRPGNVAARANFVTLRADRTIADRRAGRIGSDEGRRLVEKLTAAIPAVGGVPVAFAHVMEYRFCVALQGQSLGENVLDTDPQVVDVPPLTATGDDASSNMTAGLFNELIAQVENVLRDEPVANGMVIRGVAAHPDLPDLGTMHNMRCQVIASYPDYRGVASMVGMDVCPIEGEGELFEEKVAAYESRAESYDYTFLHIKKTDSYGEDGNFEAKKAHIEAFDRLLPRLLAKEPTVVCITGDHSTPASMRAHSWHPVPLLIRGPHQRRGYAGRRFGESDCAQGVLGRLPSQRVMGLLLAQAGRLQKYGA